MSLFEYPMRVSRKEGERRRERDGGRRAGGRRKGEVCEMTT